MAPDELPYDPELEALLRQLDHPVPHVTARDVVVRARRSAAPLWARAAAMVAGLVLFGGVAWALPGSPLPRWIEAIAAGPRSRGAEAVPPGAQVSPSGPLGIAVEATNGMVVRVVGGNAGGWLRVTLWEEASIDVRSPSSSTSFASVPEGLTVTHASADTLQLRIPRRVSGIRILVDSREVLRTEEDGPPVTGAPSVGGAWLIPLGPDPG